MESKIHCPDCDTGLFSGLTRRQFVKTVGVTAAAASVSPAIAKEEKPKAATSETLVKKLFDSLSAGQKEAICFDWNHKTDDGLLRTRVSANWNITQPLVTSKFFTKDQQEMIEAIYFSLYNPDWHERIRKQLQDDAGGYGKGQSIAIFGQPGTGQFEFVMTGRHLTIRCDGDTTENVAFGGPIFYGHAAQGFTERPDHPGNVFWYQAKKANKLYEMLDGPQRELALVPTSPRESDVHFRGSGGAFAGIPVSELSKDQQAHLDDVLAALVEPYRGTDREEARHCLQAQGGLEKCNIAFFQSGDLGDDGVWDVWRLEGPAFVWHFRGAPHVHVWVNVASDPNVSINTG